MKDSKLITILQCFTKNEFKSFEKFINSPYFSIGRDVNGLFLYLKKYYPEFNHENIEKKKLFEKLFPGEKYSEKKLVNLSSNLTKLAEQFLIHNSIMTGGTESRRLLAEQYLNRNIYNLFLNTIKPLENNISTIFFNGADGFEEGKKILKLKERFYNDENQFTRSAPYRVQHGEYSAVSFLIEFLKKLKDRIIFPLFYNIPFENILLDSIFKSIDLEKLKSLLESEKYQMSWLIEIYYNIYLAIVNHTDLKSEDYYFKSKDLFFDNIAKFSRAEKCYIFNDLAIYCLMRDPSNGNFTREGFEVYKRMLEENAYSQKDEEYMHPSMFWNIILWAIYVLQYEWAEAFTEKYSDKLKPEYRANMISFAKANIYFEKGLFENALVQISNVKQDFLLYKLEVRNLKFKIYYELNLFDQAYSLVDAYRHFLATTDEIPKQFKIKHLEFINIYSHLLKAKTTGILSEIDFITEKIKSMEGYELVPWLLQKVSELKQKRS